MNLGEILYPVVGMVWIQYSGRWGEVGEVGWTTSPYGPAYQDWWNEDPLEGVTSATSPLSLNSGGIIIVSAVGILIFGGLVFALRNLVRRVLR